MRKCYETMCDMFQKGDYNPTVLGKKENSQFLNSIPQPKVAIGFIPMTGEGIGAQVDDLSFTNNDNIGMDAFQSIQENIGESNKQFVKKQNNKTK